jgi:hypothetical protein
MTDEERLFLKRAVPIIENHGQAYCVRIAMIPQPWQDELREHLRREAVPIFDEDGQGDWLYAWDWDAWLEDRLYCPL